MPHTRNEMKKLGHETWKKITGQKEKETITVRGWVARDSNDVIAFFYGKPVKNIFAVAIGLWFTGGTRLNLKRVYFPSVKWEDEEPTPATLTIEIEK